MFGGHIYLKTTAARAVYVVGQKCTAEYCDNNLINHNIRYRNSNITIRIKISRANGVIRAWNEFPLRLGTIIYDTPTGACQVVSNYGEGSGRV